MAEPPVAELRVAELRVAELRVAEPPVAELQLAALRVAELRVAELRVAEPPGMEPAANARVPDERCTRCCAAGVEAPPTSKPTASPLLSWKRLIPAGRRT